jgi:HK97 family phage major capsid protein
MSSTRRAALEAEKTAQLKAAREIATRAEKAGRDFTASERSQVHGAVEAARKAHQSILELDGDDALIKQINSLGDVGGSTTPLAAAGESPINYRASGLSVAGPLDLKRIGTAFDTAASKATGSSGRKALLETGSIGMGIVTLTEGHLGDDIARIAERPTRVLDLVRVAPTDGDRFRYFRQTVRTNNAAPVAVGTTKPTSIYTVEDVDDRTRTYAHLSEPFPRQYLDDSGMLRTLVEQELRHGVLEAIEDDLVAGDGIGEHIDGLLEISGTQAQAWDTSLLVTTRKAKLKLEVADLAPSVWLLNPADWAAMELLRTEDGGAGTGAFLLDAKSPIDTAQQRLWSVPVVVTNAIPAGTGILADLGDVVLVMREDVRVDVSENVADDFEKNLVRIRAEARAGVAFLRPFSTVEVDLTA